MNEKRLTASEFRAGYLIRTSSMAAQGKKLETYRPRKTQRSRRHSSSDLSKKRNPAQVLARAMLLGGQP
jgi:hypothetical protein